jgi:hypothetical protein
MGQGEGLFRRLHVRWSFAFRVFFPASQPVEQRHKRIGVPRMFFPAPWLSAALDLRQSYREAPGGPSGGFGAASSSEPCPAPVPVANRQHRARKGSAGPLSGGIHGISPRRPARRRPTHPTTCPGAFSARRDGRTPSPPAARCVMVDAGRRRTLYSTAAVGGAKMTPLDRRGAAARPRVEADDTIPMIRAIIVEAHTSLLLSRAKISVTVHPWSSSFATNSWSHTPHFFDSSTVATGL